MSSVKKAVKLIPAKMSAVADKPAPTAADDAVEDGAADEVKLIPIVADPAVQRIKLDGLVKQFVDRFVSMQRSTRGTTLSG